MNRLKPKEVAGWRAARLEASGGKCELCLLPVKRAVGDHSHKTGLMRGCICAGCNSLLGRLENNAPRYGVNLQAFCDGLSQYLFPEVTPGEPLFHPSFRTQEERKLRAKKRKVVSKSRA